MTTAVEIIEMLLDGPIPVQEANATLPAPAADRNPLRVFGNDAPPKGWFYTGPDPFGDFIRYQRGGDALLNRAGDRQLYINYFTRHDYILVFKEGNGFTVFSRGPLHIPQDGIKALEQTMGLQPASPMSLNGVPGKASEIIYGQPNRANQQPEPEPEPEAEDTLEEPTTRLLKATFGGAYGEAGYFDTGAKVNVRTMRTLLADGHAFVIKYPTGSFNVIMPERYRFAPEAIHELETKMGLNKKSITQWFIGEIKPGTGILTTASESIYGDHIST